LQRDTPRFRELADFLRFLDERGQLRRIREAVSVVHEVTEIHRRVVSDQGPALLFEQPIKADGSASAMPLLTNLFGTVERVAWGKVGSPRRAAEIVPSCSIGVESRATMPRRSAPGPIVCPRRPTYAAGSPRLSI
jgi:4-hydroxy-3-polyprenylbenzoate decarboxylase